MSSLRFSLDPRSSLLFHAALDKSRLLHTNFDFVWSTEPS